MIISMRQSLVVLVACLLFVGCATPRYADWHKPGAAEYDFDSDVRAAQAEQARIREVDRASQRLSSAITGYSNPHAGLAGSIVSLFEGKFIQGYLKERGWTKK